MSTRTLSQLSQSLFFILATQWLAFTYGDEFSITTRHVDSHIRVLTEGNATILDVTSSRGIDQATVTRRQASWPKALVVRLHLKGLEGFKVTVNHTTYVWSVASSNGSRSSLSRIKDGAETLIAANDPAYADVRIIGDNKTIPLQDGYFELKLPPACLQIGPSQLKLEWIDFYR